MENQNRRFQLLEIDENPAELRAEAERRRAAEAQRQAEEAAAAEAERMRRIEQLAYEEALAKAAATHAKRDAKRDAKKIAAKAERNRATVRATMNANLYEVCSGRVNHPKSNYYDTVAAALSAVEAAMDLSGAATAEGSFSPERGRHTLVFAHEALGTVYVAVTLYQMPSGRWELVAYVSGTERAA